MKKNHTVTLLSNIVASSLMLHSETGGIIPEVAAREQLKYILPVISEALSKADACHSVAPLKDLVTIPHSLYPIPPDSPIDAIAITYGPGLIGSLLVGVETARTLSYMWNIPIIPVNHMVGHIYANWLKDVPVISKNKVLRDPMEISHSVRNDKEISFPALVLVVSGGHTDLLLMKAHGDLQLLGGTRDDAAGECFDKCARLLGLPYPGGPEIEKRAKLGNPKVIQLPRPLIGSPDYDFSFSGLKTAVLKEVKKLEIQARHPGEASASIGSSHKIAIDSLASLQNDKLEEETVNNLCASILDAIIHVLVKKTLKAAEEYDVSSIILSGGVAANQTLRDVLEQKIKDLRPATKIFAPQKSLCTDNAAMIASAAYFNYHPIPWQDLTPDPELYF